MIAGETDRPLIVQSDGSLLIDVHNPGFEGCREAIAPFAELEKSPEHIHTYRITPLSLWNAASAGIGKDDVLDRLERWTRFPVPDNVRFLIGDTIERFGKLILRPSKSSDTLLLTVADSTIRAELAGQKSLERYLIPTEDAFIIRLVDRGTVKQALIKLGYPVKDEAPFRRAIPYRLASERKVFPATLLSYATTRKRRQGPCTAMVRREAASVPLFYPVAREKRSLVWK